MSIQISWTIEGEQQVSRMLQKLETNIKNFSVPLNRISKTLVDLFSHEVFDTQGGAIGESWKPLAKSTLDAKKRKGYPATPLIATGDMQRGFKSLVSSDQAVIYNTQDYFKYHQSNQPRTKIPRRVMMKLGNKQKELVVKAFKEFILDQ